MGKQLAHYGFSLIALYLIVNNVSGAGKAFTDGAAGGATVIKAFQGRN